MIPELSESERLNSPEAVDRGHDKPRIEVTEWRELWDDEDGLYLAVFAAGDTTTSQDMILKEFEGEDTTVSFDWDELTNPVDHPLMTINEEVITDGQILQSHDGRRFLVRITEIAPSFI